MAVIDLLRRVPAWAWGILTACGLGYTFWMAGSAFVGSIKSHERARILAEGAAVDDIRLVWQRELFTTRLDSARRLADRLRDSVGTQVRTVRLWAPLVPDSLRAKYGAVDSLVRACTRLARDCDSLRTTTATIDTLTDTVFVLDSTRVRSLQLALVQRDDRIRALEWRTCKLPAAIGTGLGIGAGILLGRNR
jgi:hypothetical protein